MKITIFNVARIYLFIFLFILFLKNDLSFDFTTVVIIAIGFIKICPRTDDDIKYFSV